MFKWLPVFIDKYGYDQNYSNARLAKYEHDHETLGKSQPNKANQ